MVSRLSDLTVMPWLQEFDKLLANEKKLRTHALTALTPWVNLARAAESIRTKVSCSPPNSVAA
jgi:hypothetical protein